MKPAMTNSAIRNPHARPLAGPGAYTCQARAKRPRPSRMTGTSCQASSKCSIRSSSTRMPAMARTRMAMRPRRTTVTIASLERWSRVRIPPNASWRRFPALVPLRGDHEERRPDEQHEGGGEQEPGDHWMRHALRKHHEQGSEEQTDQGRDAHLPGRRREGAIAAGQQCLDRGDVRFTASPAGGHLVHVSDAPVTQPAAAVAARGDGVDIAVIE